MSSKTMQTPGADPNKEIRGRWYRPVTRIYFNSINVELYSVAALAYFF